MNKLIKLIYVNILKMLDLNKAISLYKKNIKSNIEVKAIWAFIIALLGGYLLYKMYFTLNIEVDSIIMVAFIISVFLSFMINFKNINDILFYDTDTEYLFSLPISTKQVVLSKLFSIYIKNIVYVIIVMISSIVAFYSKGGSINEDLGIMLIISLLMIPLIPIIIVTMISFAVNYVKVRSKVFFNILKLVLLGSLILIIYLIKDQNLLNLSYYCYPLLYLFKLMVSNCDVISFVLIIGISITLVYLYTVFISDKYMSMVSILKGVNKRKTKYCLTHVNCGKFIGIMRKELSYILNNHKYFMNTYGMMMMVSGILICLVIFKVNINIDLNLVKMHGPNILSMCAAIGVFTINSVSLEQNNWQVIRSLPIGFNKYLLGKVCSNIIINSIFIVINGLCYSKLFMVHGFDMVISFILPFSAVLFNVVMCLLLDLRFYLKGVSNEGEILNSRLLNIVPIVIAFLIGLLPFLFHLILEYKIVLLTFVAIMLLGVLLSILNYIIHRKKIINNLFD